MCDLGVSSLSQGCISLSLGCTTKPRDSSNTSSFASCFFNSKTTSFSLGCTGKLGSRHNVKDHKMWHVCQCEMHEPRYDATATADRPSKVSTKSTGGLDYNDNAGAEGAGLRALGEPSRHAMAKSRRPMPSLLSRPRWSAAAALWIFSTTQQQHCAQNLQSV